MQNKIRAMQKSVFNKKKKNETLSSESPLYIRYN